MVCADVRVHEGSCGDGDKRHPQPAAAPESGDFGAGEGGRRRRKEKELEVAEMFELQRPCRGGDAIAAVVARVRAS